MSQPVNVIRTSQGPQVGPYIFGKTLGTGSTGKVKLAKNLDTGEVVAIKIVRKDFLDRKPSLKKKMRREISVLKMLSHPNVMSLIDVFEIETHLFLVMEFVDGLELFEYLVRRGALPPDEARAFFQQIICGLEYCHRRLICHRDLKPENLVCCRSERASLAYAFEFVDDPAATFLTSTLNLTSPSPSSLPTFPNESLHTPPEHRLISFSTVSSTSRLLTLE
jgi:serine/threonine protein kinase